MKPLKREQATAFARAHFESRKKSGSAFSLRGAAKSMGVSPSYLSRILSGEKKIPLSRVVQLGKALGMDEAALSQLTALLGGHADAEDSCARTELSHYDPVTARHFDLLSTWYLLPLLDYFTCENASDDPAVAARRLGLEESQVRSAIAYLNELGHLEKSPEGFRKTRDKIRFPAKDSKTPVRNYHREMLAKARQCLGDTDKQAYARRLITGGTVAVNPANLEYAKRRLNEVLHEVMDVLLQGPCTEVYQLNFQLFPLTR